jgi:hypothetical protein
MLGSSSGTGASGISGSLGFGTSLGFLAIVYLGIGPHLNEPQNVPMYLPRSSEKALHTYRIL